MITQNDYLRFINKTRNIMKKRMQTKINAIFKISCAQWNRLFLVPALIPILYLYHLHVFQKPVNDVYLYTKIMNIIKVYFLIFSSVS